MLQSCSSCSIHLATLSVVWFSSIAIDIMHLALSTISLTSLFEIYVPNPFLYIRLPKLVVKICVRLKLPQDSSAVSVAPGNPDALASSLRPAL